VGYRRPALKQLAMEGETTLVLIGKEAIDSIGGRIGLGGEGGLPSRVPVGPDEEEEVQDGALVTLLSDLN
jgi:hypothetical protein